MVKMIQVDSSNIDAIGYDPVEKELFVKFKNDGRRIYRYLGVPKMVWQRMLRFDSKGTFVKQILIPYFDVEQTTEEDVLGARYNATNSNYNGESEDVLAEWIGNKKI